MTEQIVTLPGGLRVITGQGHTCRRADCVENATKVLWSPQLKQFRAYCGRHATEWMEQSNMIYAYLYPRPEGDAESEAWDG